MENNADLPTASMRRQKARMHQAFLDLSPEQRLERFMNLQTQSQEMLMASPEGMKNFMARNRHKRRCGNQTYVTP